MYLLNLDPEGYLLSISYAPEGAEPGEAAIETLEGLDLAGERIGAYRWDGEGLRLDEDKLAAIQAAERERRQAENAAIEIHDLKAKLAATDYAVIKIAEGSATAEEYAEVIAQRKAWREMIAELEG